MSRGKKLLILIAILIVCVAAYFAVSHFAGKDSSSDGNIRISDINDSEIESVRWIYGGSELEIKPLDDKTWYCVQDKEFPLDQDTAIEMVNAVSHLYAVKMVAENPDELHKYRINDPAIRVYVTVNGETTEYDIGNYNETSGYYYMMYTGDSALYYIDSSLYDTFACGMLDIAEYEYPPEIDINDIETLRIENRNTAVDITYYPDGREVESGEYNYLDSLSSPVDAEKVHELIDGFIDIEWNSCAAYNVAESDLMKYGLDNPSAIFSIKYKHESEEGFSGKTEYAYGNAALIIGSVAETDEYYAMIKDGKFIYTIPKDIAEKYLDFTN